MLSMAAQVSIVFTLGFLLGIASAINVSREAGFGYSGFDGPDKWGKLDPTFSSCSSGKKQSPINIKRNMTVFSRKLKPLSRNYKPANATLVNNGFNVGVRFEEFAGDLPIDGKSYALKQIHWHIPSEHRVDGQQFAAELHMVHRAPDNDTAVVAILYHYPHRQNNADPLIRKMMGVMKHLGKQGSEVAIGTLNLHELNRKHHKYFRYAGSFTTPPCAENVIWSIVGKVMPISKEEVAVLDTPLNGDCKKNARPCQPLNSRDVELYDFDELLKHNG